MKFIDLPAQYKNLRKEINSALFQTLKEGDFILGKCVKTLEERIADLVETKFAVGLNSGTDALFLSLKALGIGRGDEVITTPFSFISTAEVIVTTGAKPVFVDINPETYNIDVNKIKKAITKKTKAILPVHLYGQMADMSAIMKIARKYRLFVIEDAAQAIGASQKIKNQKSKFKIRMAGSIGIAGCFSFFPTKNLGAFGDAGMITTDSEKLAEKLKMLRNHGSKKKYYHEFLGVSSRLDEIQAGIILAKLPHLKKWNRKRQEIASFYDKNLRGVGDIIAPSIVKNNVHIYHQYTIRTKYRDALIGYLKNKNILTAIHYPIPLHLQPALKYLGYKKGDFPKAEKAAKEVLSLPLYPELSPQSQKFIIKTIKKFFEENEPRK